MMGNLLDILFKDLAKIIDQGKKHVAVQVNSTLTTVYWQVGNRINTELLKHQRANYGKEVVATLSIQLKQVYGRSFGEKNLRRMMQFAKVFPDFEIVAPAVRQLSWTHFTLLVPIKDQSKRLFYLNKSSEEGWSKRELTRQMERKLFERNKIAQNQLSTTNSDLKTTFKDPYFLGLKEGYLERDLEGAILKEIEHFILELGRGFAFVERQKRIIIDGEDFYLDLLFFHRKLKRLVAIELKLGKFKAAYKGQMELYLKWLNKYEKQEGENHPIGLILCAEKRSEQIELLEMGEEGIMVAEYWTELPSKSVLEERLHKALMESKIRLEQNKSLA